MKNPNPNMLLRIAQADAYCMACEYCERHPEEPEYAELREFKRYLTHPTYHKLPAGTYTDDTQMSIGVAEVLVDFAEKGGGSAYDFSMRWFDCFKRDPRDGYSRGFQTILEASTSPEHMISMIGANSDKNGAAMRSVPLGVLDSPERVLKIAELQAKITHNTPRGIMASQAVALMSHYALHTDRPLSGLPGYLHTYLHTDEFEQPWSGEVSWKDVGMKTAMAVCTLVSREKSLLDILRQTIEWGGDTDSVAAIAWGIASTRMREDVPAFMETDLEPNKQYGVPFLKFLGERLMEAYSDP